MKKIMISIQQKNELKSFFGEQLEDFEIVGKLGKGYEHLNNKMSLGEIGCSRSHLEACNLAVLNNDDILVLEDDAIINTSKAESLCMDIFSSYKNDQPILIHFGMNLNKVKIAKYIMGEKYNKIEGCWKIPKPFVRYLWQTVCYSANNKLCNDIININRSSNTIVRADDWVKKIPKSTLVFYIPMVVEDERTSVIGNERMIINRKFSFFKNTARQFIFIIFKCLGFKFIHGK